MNEVDGTRSLSESYSFCPDIVLSRSGECQMALNEGQSNVVGERDTKLNSARQNSGFSSSPFELDQFFFVAGSKIEQCRKHALSLEKHRDGLCDGQGEEHSDLAALCTSAVSFERTFSRASWS